VPHGQTIPIYHSVYVGNAKECYADYHVLVPSTRDNLNNKRRARGNLNNKRQPTVRSILDHWERGEAR
jgi:predicted metallo-beta-lactamase superfamily hydrolase